MNSGVARLGDMKLWTNEGSDSLFLSLRKNLRQTWLESEPPGLKWIPDINRVLECRRVEMKVIPYLIYRLRRRNQLFVHLQSLWPTDGSRNRLSQLIYGFPPSTALSSLFFSFLRSFSCFKPMLQADAFVSNLSNCSNSISLRNVRRGK